MAQTANVVLTIALWCVTGVLSLAGKSSAFNLTQVVAIATGLAMSALLWWTFLEIRKKDLSKDVYVFSRFSIISCLAPSTITLGLGTFLVFYDYSSLSALALQTAYFATLTCAVVSDIRLTYTHFNEWSIGVV